MKRILVTGGDGVLGHSIVKELRGQVVRVLSRKPIPTIRNPKKLEKIYEETHASS